MWTKDTFYISDSRDFVPTYMAIFTWSENTIDWSRDFCCLGDVHVNFCFFDIYNESL